MTLCGFNQFPENLKDEQLVRLAQKGTRDAFTVLFHRYSGYISAIVRSFHVSSEEYDDMLQEGYIGLYKAVLSFDVRRGTFKSFVSVCVSRSVISALRNVNRIPLVCESRDEDAFIETVAGDVRLEPEQVLLDQEMADMFFSLISDQLSDFELGVFSAHLEGRSYGEIAEATGRTVKSVGNAVARAKKKISFCLRS